MLTPVEAKALGEALKDAIASRDPDLFDDMTILKLFEVIDTIAEPRMMEVGPRRPLAARQALATRLEAVARDYLMACGWWCEAHHTGDGQAFSPPSGSGPNGHTKLIFEALLHNSILEPWLLAQDALFSDSTNPETAKPVARRTFTPARRDPTLMNGALLGVDDDDDDGPVGFDDDDD